MKILKKALFTFALLYLIALSEAIAQHGHGGHRGVGNRGAFHHRNNRNFVQNRRSMYRPMKTGRYYPIWTRRHSFRRRWVYFPSYNVYWDNWRSMYVYQNNALWYVNTSPPPTIVNINLENEKHYELDKSDDDLDSIYNNNPSHIENQTKK